MKFLRNLFLTVWCVFWSLIPCAGAVESAHTDVGLISEKSSIAPGDEVWIALSMRMDDGWHVYWENPGDSGLPPSIRWTLPQGWTAGAIQWPVPQKIDLAPLTSYGYEHEALFLVPLTVERSVSQGPADIQADVAWLACQVNCVPGKATLKLAVKVGSPAADDPAVADLFARARSRLPKTSTPWSVRAQPAGNAWHLHFSGAPPPTEAWFFPKAPDVIDHAAQQRLIAEPDGFRLEIPKSNLSSQTGPSIFGVLKIGETGYEIHAPISSGAGVPPSLITACLFALLGGVILNVMPCVLPVISLKIIGLTAHQTSRRGVLQHGLVFAAGVIVSFWVLAGVLLLVKNAGAQIGWGFQFQSPWFVGVMAVIFLALALNLFGVFEIGVGLTSVGGWVSRVGGLWRDFLNGLLATVVATPCTAPFMGTAIAYGLTQSAAASLAIFSFLGIGMALPTVVLSAFPGWLKFLPKPGPWMTTMKRVMGLLMLASALWLGWVLSLQTGLSSSKGEWRPYSTEVITELKAQKKSYFLDFTAAWCLTCQVNDRLVLQNPKVVEKFKEHSIILVKADWTKQDPAVTAALEGYGRNSIPFYVLYSGRRNHEEVLGETITVPGLINTLDRTN